MFFCFSLLHTSRVLSVVFLSLFLHQRSHTQYNVQYNNSSPQIQSLSLTSPITTALPSLPTLTSIYENMLPRITSVTSPHITLASVTSPTHYEGTTECRLKNSSAPAPGSKYPNSFSSLLLLAIRVFLESAAWSLYHQFINLFAVQPHCCILV